MLILDGHGRSVDRRRYTSISLDVDASYLKAARSLAFANGSVLERDGLTVAVVGVALRVVFPDGIRHDPQEITDLLRELTGNSGHPCVAVTALPFDLSKRAEMVIGEITVIARHGEQPIAIHVGDARRSSAMLRRDIPQEATLLESARSNEAPNRFELQSVISHVAFKRIVSEAIESIHEHRFEKVVLAREVKIEANHPFEQRDLLERLRSLHPSCLSFAIDGFVGATPELLLRKRDRKISSVPLAGTIARSGDPIEDRRLAQTLLASRKDRYEHRFVVDAITEGLRFFAEQLDNPASPHILELRNVLHLATTISATTTESSPSSLSIATSLHPTPAVGGTPRDAALSYIARHELLARDRYAGLVGFSDAKGDGEWWLGIRSAIINGASARILAGVGITKDSCPANELAETQLKLQAMLAVLVRP